MSEGVSFTSACGQLFSVLGSNSAMIGPLPRLNHYMHAFECCYSDDWLTTSGEAH